jgi:DNA gyrase subunit A
MDVLEKEDLIITCKSGVTIRTKISDIREAGRATQGVTLIRLDEGDEIAATSKIEEQDETVADLEEGIEPTASADGTETTEATDNPETPVVE